MENRYSVASCTNIGIVYIGDLFTNANRPAPFEELIRKGINFSIDMTWRGIIRAMQCKYNEPKHLAKENFSENELEVEVNQRIRKKYL